MRFRTSAVAALVLGALLAFGLTACGGGGVEPTEDTAAQEGQAKREEAKALAVREQFERRAHRHERQQRRKMAAARRRKEKQQEERQVQKEEEATEEQASQPKNTETKACGSYSGKDSYACEDSYTICGGEAQGVVERYYAGEGTSLDQFAESYAKETYVGHADPYEDLVWQAGFAGCLAALMDEYDTLYR